MALMLSGYPALSPVIKGRLVTDEQGLASALRSLDFSPVVDLHKMAVLYVGPDQTTERQILGNRHGSPSYTRFLANIAPLISLKNPPAQIYHQGLDFNTGRDGEYAYMYFDDIIQIAFHVATMMPNPPHDTNFTMKKSHLGNIHVRVVWNDSGLPYAFDTLKTDFQFVNIVIEPHSVGAMAAYSNSVHEHDFFRVTCQRVAGMPEFGPIGTFKLISAANLPVFIRQVGLLADFFTQIYTQTAGDTIKYDHITNWRTRLIYIQNVRKRLQPLEPEVEAKLVKILSEPASRDFTGQF